MRDRGLVLIGFIGLIMIGSCHTTPRPVVVYGYAESPPQAALRIWAYEHDVASPRCAEQVHSILWETGSLEELEARCGRKNIAGCMESYDPKQGAVVLLREDIEGQTYDVRVHESLHVLLWCAGIGRYEENHHQDLVWRHVPMESLATSSPWYVNRPAAGSNFLSSSVAR